MVNPADAAAELLNRREARRGLAAYIRYTKPDYFESNFSNTVCAAIDQFIDDMIAGKRPILIFQSAPQHGKSEIVSRRLPAYLISKFPDWRIAAASYAESLAIEMANDVRRILISDEHLRLFKLPDKKQPYARNTSVQFTSPYGTGSYIGVGVDGGLTGRGYQCFVAGTKVQTDNGSICIEDLERILNSVKVLSHNGYGFEYASIKAFARSKGLGIYRVTTKSGRVFESTGEHRILTTNGYVETNKLSTGDVLMSCVPERGYTPGFGNNKVTKKSEERHVLLGKMREQIIADVKLLGVSSLRDKIPCLWPRLLQQSMQGYKKVQKAPADTKNVRNVHDGIHSYSLRREVSNLLRKGLFKSGACSPHDGRRESTLQGRTKPTERTASLCKIIQNHKAANTRTGWNGLCVMLRQWIAARSSSYRRMVEQQRIIESCNALREVPQQGSQNDGLREGLDYVKSVERVREEAIVYDIQVEKNRNFFANDILVHNCGIIDDPIKSATEALSATTKEKIWNWYQSVFMNRASKNSGQIIMATSWAQDDLSGRLIQQFSGNDRLKVLRFPAINSIDEPGYNPELPQGALVPELHPIEQLLELKAGQSDYWWSALYQQSPKALGGNVFKESGIRYYYPKEMPAKFDKIIASWDCTFKDTDGTDFVVGQVWGKYGADSYLLDQIRARMSFTKTVEAVAFLKEKWPSIREILIEDKANGPAVIDSLKSVVPGIIPVEPEGSKLARAHAVTSFWEAGNIHIQHPAVCPWTKELIDELTAFPAAAHDDQVDALSQALRRLYPLHGGISISKDALARVLGHNQISRRG